MADEPLQQILDEMRARIQTELETQIQDLRALEADVVVRARQEAEAEADKRWTSKVDAVKSEWSARLQSEVAAARAEAETRFVAESMRLRTESEQALAAENQRAAADLEAEHQRAEQELRDTLAALDETRARAQTELDRQIQDLRAREKYAIARARQEAEAEADKRWASKVDAVKSEWSARLQSEVAAVRADAEKRLVAESMRLRAESEQAFAAERRRAEAHLEADHRKAEQQLRETLAAGEAERQKLERDAHSPPDADVDSGSILAAARAIGSARTLADALALLVRSAAAQAPRVALFILNGDHFDEWSVDGIPALSHETIDLDRGGLLRAAITHGGRVSSAAGDPDRTPPACAMLPDGRAAAAVPLMLGGQAVAVLYADEGVSTTGQPIRDWAASVELLTSHAAACLASLTAVKALQVLEAGNGPGSAAEATPAGDEQSAKRYAKLLVSEIKLYNEGAVRVGREKCDLLHRLRAEIERSRRLYEERVPPSVTARASYFQQELIQTLAGGDPALLGS